MENQKTTVPKKLLILQRQLIQICLANDNVPQEFRDHNKLEPVGDKSSVLINEVGLHRQNVQRFLALEFESDMSLPEPYTHYGYVSYSEGEEVYDRYDDFGYEGAKTPDREANLKLKKTCCKKGGLFNLKNSIGHSQKLS